MNIFKSSGNAKITINGRHYSGDCVIDRGGNIIVDGVEQDHELIGNVEITVHGSVDTIETTKGNVTVAGKAGSVKTMSGDVECANVSGSVSTMSGDVTCGVIGGSVKTMSGDIRQRR